MKNHKILKLKNFGCNWHYHAKKGGSIGSVDSFSKSLIKNKFISKVLVYLQLKPLVSYSYFGYDDLISFLFRYRHLHSKSQFDFLA